MTASNVHNALLLMEISDTSKMSYLQGYVIKYLSYELVTLFFFLQFSSHCYHFVEDYRIDTTPLNTRILLLKGQSTAEDGLLLTFTAE